MVSPVKPQETPKKEKRGAKGKGKKEKVKKEGEEKKRRKKADYSSYGRYIHRLIREAETKKSKLRITSRGMAIVNSFVVDLFDRLAGEAGRLVAHAKVKTLSSKAVMAAVKMRLPGELASHALGAGASAVAAYGKSQVKKQKK
eukprot:TRINITY_DN6045_c0_g2_i1.p2 TRINITY_DN6045_c0_g2~~TRINITY_DN6045_c0_g2_i1.p2  ORF type:complete len:152 (+),score=78.37 TRINITY_DN6045_c0_g2_i1:30-458(+)